MGVGASSCINETSGPLAAKLIMVDSGAILLRRLKLPSSVAELMIEFPGHTVSRAEDLLLARRTKGMRADEQLRPGQVYVLLNRSYRADDGLADAVKGVMKKRMPGLGASRVKVVPDKKDTGCSGQLQVGGPRRVGSWRPVLDTIAECN
ncbi:uncharacterized protein A4U43_C07F12820 [Asparagus officinalis]|uniref:Uncharacterized protein n=1 Tax=Asparagus officinalis TaxID=4686 RepID=A0A5P1EEI6_ASPOF|nr:uncharacterized protein A4U43_C07F12820 [Asparagus officinalis]